MLDNDTRQTRDDRYSVISGSFLNDPASGKLEEVGGVTNEVIGVMERSLQKLDRLRYSTDRAFKNFLAKILETFAYASIDLKLQVDSLRHDFVSSESFEKAVNSVFEECDVDRNGALDTGEFFCAVLLFYHKMNRIPFSGRKNPPKRKHIYALYYRYIRLQEKAEEKLGLLSDAAPKEVKPNQSLSILDIFKGGMRFNAQSKIEVEVQPGGTIKRERRKRASYAAILFNNVFNPGPYLAAFGLVLLFEVFTCLFNAGVFRSNAVCIHAHFSSTEAVLKVCSIFLATIALILARNIYIFAQVVLRPRKSSFGRAHAKKAKTKRITATENKPKQEKKVSQKREKQRKASENEDDFIRPLNREFRSNTKVREDFILEQVKNTSMRKETFRFLCQKHFSNLVFAETWRIFIRALLVPLIAWQIKKLADFAIVSLLILLKQFSHSASPTAGLGIIDWISIREFFDSIDVTSVYIPLSIATTITMATFGLVVEPVSSSIMWSKLDDTIHQDMFDLQQQRISTLNNIEDDSPLAEGKVQGLSKKVMKFFGRNSEVKKPEKPIVPPKIGNHKGRKYTDESLRSLTYILKKGNPELDDLEMEGEDDLNSRQDKKKQLKYSRAKKNIHNLVGLRTRTRDFGKNKDLMLSLSNEETENAAVEKML